MYQHYFVSFFLSSLTGFNFWLNSVIGAVITDNSTAQAVKLIGYFKCQLLWQLQLPVATCVSIHAIFWCLLQVLILLSSPLNAFLRHIPHHTYRSEEHTSELQSRE